MMLFQHNLLELSMIICLQFADTQFQLLSGGEKKRCRFLCSFFRNGIYFNALTKICPCSIATELLSRPWILLLDEAASGSSSTVKIMLNVSEN